MRLSSRNIRQDLATMSGKSVRDVSYSRLANKYMGDVKAREAEERSWEHEVEFSVPHVEYVRNAIARALKDDSMNNDMPLSPIFEALQIAKSHKSAAKDTGIRQLVAYLNKKWESDRIGSITIGDFKDMERRFANQYPKSQVINVLEEINKKGYMTLPVNDLVHIASQIETQEDFERVVMKHSLHGNQPHNVKARNFILSVVNTESEKKQAQSTSHGVQLQDGNAEEFWRIWNEGGADEEVSSDNGSWALLIPEKIIINKDSQDFVTYSQFDTEDEMYTAWEAVQSENSTFGNIDDDLYEDEDSDIESCSDGGKKMSTNEFDKYKDRIIDDILNDHIVAYNDWNIMINNDDQVEVWPPSGDGFGTSIAHLDKAVNDFIKKAIVEPKVNVQQPDAVNVGNNPIGADTTGKEIKLVNKEVNQQVKPDGEKSSPKLGPDSTMKVPKGMDPAVNYRPGVPNTKMTSPDLGPDSSGKDPLFIDKGHKGNKGAGKDPFNVTVNEQLKDKRTDSDQKSDPKDFYSKHVTEVEEEKEGKEGRIEDTFSHEPDASHIYRELVAKRPAAEELSGLFDGSWEAKSFFRHVAEIPTEDTSLPTESRGKEEVMAEINQIRAELAEIEERNPLNEPLPEEDQARMLELREMKKVLMEEYRGVKYAKHSKYTKRSKRSKRSVKKQVSKIIKEAKIKKANDTIYLAGQLLGNPETRRTIIDIFERYGDESVISDYLETAFSDDPYIVDQVSGNWRGLANSLSEELFGEGFGEKPGELNFDSEKDAKVAGNKFREKWDNDGAYSREVEAESAGDLHNIIKSFNEITDVEFDEAEPKKIEEYGDKEIKEETDKSLGFTAATEVDSDKEAVDDEAKKYYTDYYGDFGKKLTEDKPTREQKKKNKDKKKDAQAVPGAPAPTPAVPAPAAGPMTKEMPATQTGPAASGDKAPVPGAPGKNVMEPGMGNEGLISLGWTEEDVNLIPPDQKKKILENAINKPGTGQKPVIPNPDTAPGATGAPGAPTPGVTPGAPTPGAPVPGRGAQVVEDPAAPAAPVPTAPVQPNGMDVSVGAPGGMGENGAASSIQEQLYDILSEVQGMPVQASTPDQIATVKASEFTKRIQTELGMSPDEAKRELGMNEGKSLMEQFK